MRLQWDRQIFCRYSLAASLPLPRRWIGDECALRLGRNPPHPQPPLTATEPLRPSCMCVRACVSQCSVFTALRDRSNISSVLAVILRNKRVNNNCSSFMLTVITIHSYLQSLVSVHCETLGPSYSDRIQSTNCLFVSKNQTYLCQL